MHKRQELLAAIGAIEGDVTLRAVDVWIVRLRKALCRAGEANPIRTVWGVGYALQRSPDAG